MRMNPVRVGAISVCYFLMASSLQFFLQNPIDSARPLMSLLGTVFLSVIGSLKETAFTIITLLFVGHVIIGLVDMILAGSQKGATSNIFYFKLFKFVANLPDPFVDFAQALTIYMIGYNISNEIAIIASAVGIISASTGLYIKKKKKNYRQVFRILIGLSILQVVVATIFMATAKSDGPYPVHLYMLFPFFLLLVIVYATAYSTYTALDNMDEIPEDELSKI